MASAQVVERLVTNNSPSQDSNHPDDLFQSRTIIIIIIVLITCKVVEKLTLFHMTYTNDNNSR